MFIDAEGLDNRSLIEARVMIVGGGMAGIALARQLADGGVDVAILESGGEKPDERVQSLYAGAMTVGDGQGGDERRVDDYLTKSRVRCFGGSGNVWGGKCAPLDPMDFERREWVPHSGWPFDRAALQPFYDRACELLALPRFASPADPRPDRLVGDRSPAFTPRTRAYTRYTGAVPDGPYAGFKNATAQHPRVRVYLNANVTRILLREDGSRVAGFEVGGFSGKRHTARADVYVLATGGIENVRLLLVSNDVHPRGIGNHSDWLGRGFQGHTTIGRQNTSLWAYRSPDAIGAYNIGLRDTAHVVLGASDAAQRRDKRLNFTTTLSGAVATAPRTTSSLHAIGRRLDGASGAAHQHQHQSIYFMVENVPDRRSQVTVDPADRDPLGMPRVRLHMHHSEIEFDTLERSIFSLARELGRIGAGRLQWSGTRADWQESMTSLSRHHMGATRMSVSAGDGVVDEHGRVHGVSNLFVAGSSIFPTSGIANPTLTLLALTFRMGDRLLSATGGLA
jgi:choline dehydrogenase-like flavoprotein